MSFITRCPACATAFKVVPDQLKISDGWVRCGQCQHIFDATLDLQPWWPGQLEPSPPPPPPSPEPPVAVLPSEGTTDRHGDVAAPSPHEPEPVEPFLAAHDTDLSLEPEFREAEAPTVDPHATVPDRDDPREWEEPPSEVPREFGPAPEVAPEVEPQPQPAFVRQAQRRAFWRRPWVRVGLSALVLAMLGVLAVQAAYHWRDQLSSRLPATEPALNALCVTMDCVIAPPRQLDDVVIDSSVLLRRSPGRYSFNVVIRNKSALEVAAPALELTLTDSQDQVLVRRVLLPAEWPRPIETLPPSAEWALQFDLALADLSDQVMTGYRAILFYP